MKHNGKSWSPGILPSGTVFISSAILSKWVTVTYVETLWELRATVGVLFTVGLTSPARSVSSSADYFKLPEEHNH